MKKAVPIFITVVILVSSLGGCQATPDKPVVVQKDMEQMIETGIGDKEEQESTSNSSEVAPTEEPEIPKHEYTELCEHYGVPERFQTTITEGNLTINCDVQIELPDTLTLPMARVEAGRFSQEQVYVLFNALCGDTQMYISPWIRDKAYYEQRIIEFQADLAKETEEDTIKWFNTVIEDLKEQYSKAPETLEITLCDGTMRTHEIEPMPDGTMAGTQLRLDATSDPYDLETPTTILVQNDIDFNEVSINSFEDEFGNTQIVAPRSCSMFVFSRNGAVSHFNFGSMGAVYKDITEITKTCDKPHTELLQMSPKQARSIVEQFLEDAALNELMIDTVYFHTTKKELPPEYLKHLEEMGRQVSERPEKHMYVFRLLRKVNGVKTESTQECSETSVDGLSFGAQWYYEKMLITVDDGGIASVGWDAPLHIIEQLTDDTQILPFEEIQHIFEKMVVIKNGWYISSNREQLIDITHVSLSLQRIMERDSYTTGLLVPVWNFYGSETTWDKDGEARTIEWKYMPIISINAIDGSIIDVYKGY